MHLKRYLLIYLCCTGLVLASAAAINYAVDPYDLFGQPRQPGFNQIKPAASTRVRVIKPYQVARLTYETIVIGNSRPELGLNPDSSCWPEETKPVYNFSVPGAGVYSQYLYALHALNKTNASTLMLGVDFADFIVSAHEPATAWPPAKSDYEGRLSTQDPASPNSSFAVLKDYANASLSLTALVDSIRTVTSQNNKLSSNRTSSGFNPGRDFIATIRGEGQHSLFKQKNEETRKRFSRSGLSIRHDNGESTAMRSFRALLELAADREIRLIVFINPYHDDYLSAIKNSGYEQLFQKWKSSITEEVSKFPGVALLDFAIPTSSSAESSPAAGDKKTILKWYWEPGHYRQTLGDQMLGTIFGVDNCTDPALGSMAQVLVAPPQ